LRKIFFALAFFLAIASATFAAGVSLIDGAKNTGITIECPAGVVNCSDDTKYETADAQNFILRIVGGLLNFVAVVAVVMLVVVAIRLVTALGNQENLQVAKKQLIWTFAGLAIIILGLLIVQNITEKIYEVTSDCPTIVVDGLYGPETKKASGETAKLAQKWCQKSWPADEKTEDTNVRGFQSAYNSAKCSNAPDYKRIDITEVGTTTCDLKCDKKLDPDGLLGPLTDEARKETPKLAATFVEPGDEETVCFYPGQSVAEMPVRKSGEPECEAVREFQNAYNSAKCDKETGKKIDSGSSDSSSSGGSGGAGAEEEEKKATEKTGCEAENPVCKIGDQAKKCVELNKEKYSSGEAPCNTDCSGWDESKCEEDTFLGCSNSNVMEEQMPGFDGTVEQVGNECVPVSGTYKKSRSVTIYISNKKILGYSEFPTLGSGLNWYQCRSVCEVTSYSSLIAPIDKIECKPLSQRCFDIVDK
jgi:hypothetical protein